MSPDIAQALRGVARGRQSFVVLAVPRLAGKSTVLRAILAERPNAAAVMTLAEDGENVDELLKKSAGGYIVIPEITQSAAMPGYISGAEVRRIFRAAKEGVSLAATLHAEDRTTHSRRSATAVACRTPAPRRSATPFPWLR